MSAEQHNHHFSDSYLASKEQVPKKELTHTSEEIRQFDLNFSFRGLPDLMKRFGPERGLFQCMLGVALNIWSVRQEMLGEMDTRELITLVTKEVDGTLRFQNDLFGQAQDLRSMYEAGIHSVSSALRPRYKREADQAIHIFETLTTPLKDIDLSLPEKELEAKLLFHSFHEEDIDISPSMIANIQSLRSRIDSIDDLDSVITQKPKRRAFVGPIQAITGSPSHWSHHKGETIFAWASECIVFPDTKEMCIRQNGKFGKGKDENLLPYLTYQQKELPAFRSEDELMQFTNMLMEMEYRQPKALLDFLVKQLGGIKPAGKIDRQIKEGPLSIKPYMKAITELFQFELSQLETTSSAKIAQRLGDFSEKIKHQIARNQPKALDGLVAKYLQLIDNQPQLSVQDFIQQMNTTALSLDKGFSIKIDFSLLDCVAGTPMSLMGNVDALSNVQMNIGTEKLSLLQSLDSRREGITSRAELERFCKAFGKDASKYSTIRECGMCHKQTFVWGKEHGGCDVCPVCEVKDDLGISGAIPKNFFDPNNEDSFSDKGLRNTLYSKNTIGVSDFLSASTSGWQQFMLAA